MREVRTAVPSGGLDRPQTSVTSRPRLTTGLLAVALSATAASGYAGNESSRALYPVGSTHALCFSSDRGQTITEGLDVIANRGPAPVRIDRAQWLNSTGLTLLSISLFQRGPQDEFASFGEWHGYPPNHLARAKNRSYLVAWRRRQPAQGATLPESDADQQYFNILVSWTGRSGTAGPVRLSYTDADGHHGTVDTLVTVTVRPRCK